MLMDGQLVALPEEDRRAMRAAADAAKRTEHETALTAWHSSEAVTRATRSHRATTDLQPSSCARGSLSEERRAISLDVPRPAQYDLPAQRPQCRCALAVRA